MTTDRINPRHDELMAAHLRGRIERAVPGVMVQYEYQDSRQRRAPEWRASLIRVRCFFPRMGEPRYQLFAALEAMEGCVKVRDIGEHRTLRPMVEAYFRRRYL